MTVEGNGEDAEQQGSVLEMRIVPLPGVGQLVAVWPDDVLTTRQVGQLLGITTRQVSRLLREQEVGKRSVLFPGAFRKPSSNPKRYTHGHWRVPRSAVLQYWQRQQKDQNDAA